jgi:hypothetical protein
VFVLLLIFENYQSLKSSKKKKKESYGEGTERVLIYGGKK